LFGFITLKKGGKEEGKKGIRKKKEERVPPSFSFLPSLFLPPKMKRGRRRESDKGGFF